MLAISCPAIPVQNLGERDFETMIERVRIGREGEIAILTIDNPPINAASYAVRAGLLAAMNELGRDASIRGVLLTCAARTFVAGADIHEFAAPPVPPALRDVCDAIEALEKPVAAVLYGTALGGGFELALACHYRIIDPQGAVGLPEVTLGLIPGAGGTQRLPRLAGLPFALDMIVSSRRVGSVEALAAGLVDAVIQGDRLAFALAFLRERLERPLCPLSRRPGPARDDQAIAAARAGVAKRQAGQAAPVRAIDAVEASTRLGFAEGMALEREIFAELRSSPQARALRHIFFAERATGKVHEIEGVAPRSVARVGIVGGGTMGAGIAAAVLLSGLWVDLVERDARAADAAKARVTKILDGAVVRKKLAAADHARLLGERLTVGADMAGLGSADLAIEAVIEDVETKKSVFRALDRVLRPGTVLATNTSYLDVALMAAATDRAADVIGLHFFSPAHIMKLLEIVVPPGASAEAVATGFAFGRALGKLCVRAGNAEGFIGNRILSAYRKTADRIMLKGASPAEIDAAFRAFGFPMGVFEMQDLAGLDIGWANRKRLAAVHPPDATYVRIADRICELGHFGRKTGQGFYSYGEGAAMLDSAAEAIITEERKASGIEPRAFSAEAIMARILAAMVNEAAKVLEEGVALRAGDIDVVMVNGYGFPRWQGGPMHMADERGLAEVLAEIEDFAAEDPRFWLPAALLRERAAEGGKLGERREPLQTS